MPQNKHPGGKEPVIIVGGGISGLAAARQLLRHGVPVILLEAKKRFGGRIHTLHHGSCPIELGAEFVHGRDPALLKTIREAGLKLQPIAGRNLLSQNGKLKPIKLWDQFAEAINQVRLNQPDQSFQQFIHAHPFDPQTKRLLLDFVTGFDAANPARIGTHGLLKAERSAETMSGEKQARVKEGYASLINFLLKEIRARGGVLIQGVIVEHVRWQKGAVEIHSRAGRRTVTHHARAAIFTLPLGVWKTRPVKFTPALKTKVEAIHNLEFGHVMKMTFVFRQQNWLKPGDGFIHALDQPIPTWWSDPRGPTLTAWAGGSQAGQFTALTPAKFQALALRCLSRILSEPVSSLRSQLVAAHLHNWKNDPDIRGAYSYLPVNGLALPRQLAAPVQDTLFFAGEATAADAQMGTVFGALESGLRAVKELLR